MREPFNKNASSADEDKELRIGYGMLSRRKSRKTRHSNISERKGAFNGLHKQGIHMRYCRVQYLSPLDLFCRLAACKTMDKSAGGSSANAAPLYSHLGVLSRIHQSRHLFQDENCNKKKEMPPL
jgi:hypothetical protein